MSEPTVEITRLLAGEKISAATGEVDIRMLEIMDRLTRAVEELQGIASEHEARITAVEP